MSSTSLLASVEKLQGRENFSSWQFSMKIFLEHEGLLKCIDGSETDEKKNTRAKTSIILSIDKINYVHIQSAETAKDVWDTLHKTFDDSGLSRKVGLLRVLITTRLENCGSMEKYVNDIVMNAHKLNGVGLEVSEEWIGAFLLAGLPEEYRPMIMAIENSGMKISGDSIKTKLLQEVKFSSEESSSSSALFNKFSNGKYKNKFSKTNYRCYKCHEKGHKAAECTRNLSSSSSRNHHYNGGSSRIEPQSFKSSSAFSAIFLSGKFNENEWFIDSGASSHMCMHKSWFNELRESTIKEISTANNSKMRVCGIGEIELSLKHNEKVRKVQVKNVLYIPEITANLLSVSSIMKNQNRIEFVDNECRIYDCEGMIITSARLINNLYTLSDTHSCVSMIASAKPDCDQYTWHRRFGHVNNAALIKMRDGAVNGVVFKGDKSDNCDSCAKGKQSRNSFNKEGSRANELLEIVHSDLCGPMENPSIGGARFALIFVDDYSRMTHTYFLKSKIEVFDTFEKYKQLVENQLNRRIKVFRSDNGTEFVNTRMNSLFTKCGIVHQKSTPYTPQQNGLAERTIRTITEKARCLLYDADLAKCYWAEAMNAATYLKNRTISNVLNDKSPIEIWCGKKPSVGHLRVFGCECMVHVPDEKRLKWDAKSRKLRFIGYCDHTKGYRLIDPMTMKVYTSRDVIFYENQKEVKSDGENITFDIGTGSSDSMNSVNQFKDSNDADSDADSDSSDNETFVDVDNSTLDPSYRPSVNVESIVNSPIRRSERIRKAVSNSVSLVAEEELNSDPISVREALDSVNSKEWKEAMHKEYQSLLKNETWTLVSLPNNRKTLNNKWVFKTKSDLNNKVFRFKARLVAKGCSQVYGLDYDETFAPVVRYTSIRVLFALAARGQFEIDQMDATTAFLQGDIEEKIYMKQPEMFDDGSGRVCLLRKSIYGLKQASRQWNKKLNQVLLSGGYVRSTLDPCVYMCRNGSSVVYAAIYVDDILIFSNNTQMKDSLKRRLSTSFEMKDLGEASSCVGIQVTRDRSVGKILLNQSKYIDSILTKYRINDCNPVKSPTDVNQRLTKEMAFDSSGNAYDMANIPYQEAIGSLLYLVQCTRPDIAHAVGVVSRFNQQHGPAHWAAVKRIFKYLKGTKDYKLVYSPDGKDEIVGYTDADWASDSDDRKSFTGYVFTLNGGAISWASKKQQTVALSSTEAEYMAMAMGCQEATWLRQFYSEITFQQLSIPTTIFCDNRSALNLAKSDAYSVRTKHIDVRHHFVRDKINEGQIVIEPISTTCMIADSLTKNMSTEKQLYCSLGMGLIK